MISVLKPGTSKRIIYENGDFIHLMVGEKEVTGDLFYISDSLLIIGSEIVYPDSISMVIDYSKGNFPTRLSQKLIAGGIFYLLLTTVNRIGNKDDPVFTEYNLKISGGLALSGIIVGLFKKRKFKLNKNSQLTILNP